MVYIHFYEDCKLECQWNQRIDHVVAWIEDNQPDVLALQETKVVDELFLMMLLRVCPILLKPLVKNHTTVSPT